MPDRPSARRSSKRSGVGNGRGRKASALVHSDGSARNLCRHARTHPFGSESVRMFRLAAGTGAVRPSRQPLRGFLRMRFFLMPSKKHVISRRRAAPSRQPLRGFLRMRVFLNALTEIPHPEEARSAVSKDAEGSCSARCRQFHHELRGTAEPGGIDSADSRRKNSIELEISPDCRSG